MTKELPAMKDRPKCCVPRCNERKQYMGTWAKKTNQPIWRKTCAKHHFKATAKKQGFTGVTEWRNSWHSYRKHRKTYCENRDGRLGFICRYTIKYSGQLQVDHKNGKPYDDRKCNLQTLCANCHIFKTSVNEDYATPGRKQLAERIHIKRPYISK